MKRLRAERSDRVSFSDLMWVSQRMARRMALSAIPVKAHMRIATLRGRFHRISRGIPDHIRKNMFTVFGERSPARSIDEMARRHVEFSGQTYLVGVLPLHLGIKKTDACRITGVEHLDSALERGRGAILATAHFGHARLVGPLLRAKGYEAVSVVARSVEGSARSDRLLAWLEAKDSVGRRLMRILIRDALKPYHVSAHLDVRPILSALANNQPVIVAGDGLRGTDFVVAEFLGQPYPFAPGFLRIARMRRAPVLPTFAVKNDDEEIVIEISPPITVNEDTPIEESLREYVAAVEDRIRRSPHLWTRWEVDRLFESLVEWSKTGYEERENQSFGRWAAR